MKTSLSTQIDIRHQLRPGDVGRIVYLHGTYYAQTYGWDHTFEAYVAVPLGEFAKRSNERERIWLVDSDGELNGSIAIVEANAEEAQLRWLLLMPQLRGRGIGKRLVQEAIAFAREKSYSSIFLWTVDGLPESASLYRAAGFRLTREERRVLWGASVVEQRFDLSFTAT